MLLQRRIANIYIPPVKVTEEAFNELFLAHVEQKLLFQDLLRGGVDHEEILEALEAWIGTSNMDRYIQKTEQKLDLILDGC